MAAGRRRNASPTRGVVRGVIVAVVGAGLIELPVGVAVAATPPGPPTFAVTATIPVGGSPNAVAVDPALHRAFVTNFDDDTVSVIDTTTDTLATTAPVGMRPTGIAIDDVPPRVVKTQAAPALVTPVTTSRPTVFVSNSSGSISVFDAQTSAVLPGITLSGLGPQGIVADPSLHRLFVIASDVSTLEGHVAVVDDTTDTVLTTLTVDTRHSAEAIDTGTHDVYALTDGDSRLSVVNGSTFATSRLDAQYAGGAVAADAGLHRLYVASQFAGGTVTVIDTTTNAIVTTVAVGYPSSVAVDPNTHEVYVAGTNGVTVMDGNTDAIEGSVPVGRTPSAVAVDGTSHTAYVANMLDDTVSVITRTAPSVVARLAGSDRFGTAVAASKAEFPAGGAGAVVLARGDDYPDALVGAPLAAAKNAPLLLTTGASLPAATKAEVQRVLPAGGTVFVLGGTSAVPTGVADELAGLGYQVTRFSGATRFATAVAVADALGDPGTVLLATGVNFPDALSAGVAAVKAGGVVLLTSGASLPPETSGYLLAHPGTVYAVGGPAATADPSATPLVGADRFATSVAVAGKFFNSPATVGVATGLSFPDALSGGALLGHLGVPLVLVSSSGVPSPVASYFAIVKATVTKAYLFGGTSTVTAATEAGINADLTS